MGEWGDGFWAPSGFKTPYPALLKPGWADGVADHWQLKAERARGLLPGRRSTLGEIDVEIDRILGEARR